LAAGKYNVEGVGKDSVPGTMNFGVVDAMLSVTDKQCFDMCLRLSREEGLLTGGSSGLNMHAAVELSGRCNPGATIVVVLPDSGIKYLSKIYSPEWRKSKGFGGDSEDEEREPAGEGDEREPSRVATPDPDADPQTATNVERVTEALGVPRVASALKLELKDERRASIDDIDASSQNLNLLVDAQMEDVADAIDPAAEGDSETASNE